MVFARLQLYDNDRVKDVFLITPRTRLTIGRSRNNTLVLRNPKILPFHAAIYWYEDRFVLQKCHPSAETWVNQQRLAEDAPQSLNNNDQIQVGPVKLAFDLTAMTEGDRSSVSRFSLPITQVTPNFSSHILQISSDDWIQEFALTGPTLFLGNASSCELYVDSPALLPQHLKLTWHQDRYAIDNLGDPASLAYKGMPVEQRVLANGDMLRLGQSLTLKYSILDNPTLSPTVQSISLRNRTYIGFGRDPRNDVVLDHPVVSRYHAALEWQAGNWFVKDLNSSNGTFINERSSPQCALQLGDTLHIGPYEFQLTPDETLVQCSEVGKLRLDACGLLYRVGASLTLLDHVSLSIVPEEFVTIVGVSGAGKSTLLNALSGFRPATRGTVFVNGHDLYKNYDAYRTELGYVPQDDIIHSDLTVLQALDFAAQLRLPPDISPPERRRQVRQVLTDLELLEQSKTLVRNLSGGQRKRVSIGVELLTQPSLFFLDEATSGLDPGTELQMMRLLRQMASQGRTVILVTHTTKNLALSDLVVFLAKGGRIAFFGPPKAALTYFGVQEFDEIYIKVEEERSPEEWASQYQQSPYYQQYVVNRQASLNGSPSEARNTPLRTELNPASRPSPWRQFRLLSQRNLTILFQDRASFLFLLAVAPILGLLDFVMWQRHMFDSSEGEPSQCFTLLFISVLIAVIVGSLSTMREVVKEAEIYRRERMIGLQIVPYILSKVWLSAVLAIYQAAIFLITKAIAVDLPGGWITLVSMYFTLFLATLGGMVMGLLVSALSSSQNVAPLLTILFLVPQITFAGSFLPLSTLGPVGQAISELTITRWAYESMVTLSGLGKDIAQDQCWQQPESVRKSWKEAQKQDCRCMGPNLFKQCDFPALHKEYDPAVDQPEPLKPESPGDPPATPTNLLGPDGQQFADDLQIYSDQTKTYRQALDQWQDRFSQWKEKRGRAIAAGEELLGRFNKNQGNTFAINVGSHWLRLGLLILGTLGLLVGVQKRKDWV
ncbi:MAG: FHA domain-containing protein [Thermosynechococcaceae cyanobacterium]